MAIFRDQNKNVVHEVIDIIYNEVNYTDCNNHVRTTASSVKPQLN